MEKKHKFLLISIFTLIILIIIGIIILLIMKNNQQQEEEKEQMKIIQEEEIGEASGEEAVSDDDFILGVKDFFMVDIDSVYYAIKEIAEDFFDTIALSSNRRYAEEFYKEYAEEGMKESKEKLYNMLGKEYIDLYKITKENVDDKLLEYNNRDFRVETIKESIKENNICIFIVQGRINNQSEYSLAIITDENNLTYAIYPFQYIKNNNINDLKISEISNKEYNTFVYKDIKQETIVKDYLFNYKYDMQANIDKVYNNLDNQYKNDRFKTIELFKEYYNNQKNSIISAIVASYKVTEDNNKKVYEIYDSNGHYYCFKEESIMQAKVILDNYTIMDNNEISKYNKYKDTDKAAYNVYKFIKMINYSDYNAIYNILDDEFKSYKFKEKEDLKKEIKENFFENNELKINNVDEKDNYITIEGTLIDIKDSSSKKYISVIVKLGDDTNFTMSFNVGKE